MTGPCNHFTQWAKDIVFVMLDFKMDSRCVAFLSAAIGVHRSMAKVVHNSSLPCS